MQASERGSRPSTKRDPHPGKRNPEKDPPRPNAPAEDPPSRRAPLDAPTDPDTEKQDHIEV